MRCTYCSYAKETIPEQLRYVYCTKYEKEMSVVDEFETCQYEETTEYKLKVAIQKYCNDTNNHIVAVEGIEMLNALAKEFNIPNFMQDILARRKFDDMVFRILNDSQIKIKQATLVTNLGDSGESRKGVLILQKPKTF